MQKIINIFINFDKLLRNAGLVGFEFFKNQTRQTRRPHSSSPNPQNQRRVCGFSGFGGSAGTKFGRLVQFT